MRLELLGSIPGEKRKSSGWDKIEKAIKIGIQFKLLEKKEGVTDRTRRLYQAFNELINGQPDKIKDFVNSEIRKFSNNKNMNGLGALATEPLFKSSKDGKVWVIINNIRHWIVSRAVLESIGFIPGKWTVAASIPYPTGKEISSKAVYDRLVSAPVSNSLTTINTALPTSVTSTVKKTSLLQKGVDLIQNNPDLIDKAVDKGFDLLPENVQAVLATGVNAAIPSPVPAPVKPPIGTATNERFSPPRQQTRDERISMSEAAALIDGRGIVAPDRRAPADAAVIEELPQNENNIMEEKKGMSTGAKVAIGLGVAAAIAGVAMMASGKKKRRRSGLGRIKRSKKSGKRKTVAKSRPAKKRATRKKAARRKAKRRVRR